MRRRVTSATVKQLLQNLGSGETLLTEVPLPTPGSGDVLIRSQVSAISVGTEKMLVSFGKSNLIQKARQQPDKVKQVLDKVKTDGLAATYDAVKSKLDEPIPLGYSNAGVVLEVGARVYGFKPGDRVISNGSHAEYVQCPEHLVAKIPDGVSFEEASFAVIGSIALQGIRLCDLKLGETVMVTGLGLIGLITVQLLKAQGCHVLGCDFDGRKCEMAEKFGAKTVNLADGGDPVALALAATGGFGVDAVIVTASTPSSDPMHQAAQMSRTRGKIVLVGVTGLELSRDLFYKKELSFQVSCSYGPGRYDPAYEGKGLDYPYGYVRWTAQRNFEAVLACMADGRLDVKPMIEERHSFEKAAEVYGSLGKSLGVLLDYPTEAQAAPERTMRVNPKPASAPSKGVLGIIGAGNFTRRTLLPAIQAAGGRVKAIASKGGVSGTQAAQKFGIEVSTTDLDVIWNDPEIDTVMITTQHGSHASMVRRGIEAGKKVFVEKPLAVTSEQLEGVVQAYEAAESPFVMVGFNRRFAPLAQKMKSLISAQKDVKCIVYTVNAGSIPRDVWIQDPESGGGRIIGEGCHFVDFCRFLTGSPLKSVQSAFVSGAADGVDSDKGSLLLTFEDGSIATVHYLANGPGSFPKERVEVFCGGAALQLDNFRQLTGFGWPGFNKEGGKLQKGHAEEVAALLKAVREGGAEPISFAESVEVTRATLEHSGL